jgi:putative transcriptional regulator
MTRMPVFPMRFAFWLRRRAAGVLRALLPCALLLPLGASWPTTAADTKPKPMTAIFLVARSELPDPNFADSVVLVMNNLGPGPVGLIINRPTKIPVSELFPDLKQLAPLRDKIYFGGPVEIRTVWFLFRALKQPEHALQACDGVYLSADKELLLRLLHRDKPMEGLRIFIGHSGWTPEQLQNEVSRGDWTLKHAESDAVFHGQTEHPWPSPETEPST